MPMTWEPNPFSSDGQRRGESQKVHNKAISGSEELVTLTYEVSLPVRYASSISAILEQVFFFTWQFCCNHPQPGISVLKLIGEQDCSWYVPSAHAL